MVVTDTNNARDLAETYLLETNGLPRKDWEFIDNLTIETSFGWVFIWNSREYLETGHFGDCLVGAAPLIVDGRDGSVHETWPGMAIEESIDRYLKGLPPLPQPDERWP